MEYFYKKKINSYFFSVRIKNLFFLLLIFLCSPRHASAQTDSIIVEDCYGTYGSRTVDTFDVSTGLLRSEVDEYYWYNYSYNQNNDVDTFITYSLSFGAEVMVIHLYNSINKDSIILTQNYHSSVWTNSSQQLFNYDSLGRALTETDQRWDTTIWHTTGNTYYTYNGGLLDYILTVTVPPTDSTWKIYSFDSLGNYCITTVRYSFSVGARDTMAGGTCYNFRDQITSSSDDNGTYQYYSYDSLGRILSSGGESPFQGAAFWNTDYYYSCSGVLTSNHSSYWTSQQSSTLDCYYYIAGTPIFIAIQTSRTICLEDTFHFSSTLLIGTPVSYLWTPSTGLSSDTILNPYAFPDSTTTYYLTATDSAGNTYSDCVTITVKQPIPFVSIVALDTTSICYGDTVRLLASATGQITPNYYWSSNGGSFYQNGNDSIAFARSTGYYTVKVYGTNGCYSAPSNSIYVYSNTAAQGMISTNDSQGCIGDTLELITYPLIAPYHNFEWMIDSVIIPGATDSILFVTQTGWYQVTISSDTSACTYTTSPWYGYMTFSSPPTPDIFPTQDTIICPGVNLELKTTKNPLWTYYYFINGVSSQWYSASDSITLGISNPSYLKIKASNHGCIAFTDSILVDLFPYISFTIIPSISPPYCLGDTVQLSTSIPSSGAYQWYPFSTDSIVFADTTRWYSVSVVDTNGCLPVAIINMIFNTPPPVPLVAQNGGQIYCYDPGVVKQWYFNGVAIPGANNFYYNPTQAGYYTFEVTNSFGCSTMSDPFYFSPVGIESPSSETNIFIYPVVAVQSFSLFVNPEHAKGNNVFEMYDLIGRKISEMKIEKNISEIKRGLLNDGIYFWKVANLSNRDEILQSGKIIFAE